jgi:hypothetical protein
MQNSIIINRDMPRFTVNVLLLAIERRDQKNLKTCARAVIRSAYDHLYYNYNQHPTANGAAMSELLIAKWDLEENEGVPQWTR